MDETFLVSDRPNKKVMIGPFQNRELAYLFYRDETKSEHGLGSNWNYRKATHPEEWRQLQFTPTQRVQKALDELPGSPDQIAAFLSKAGVTGVPGRADRCPLAQYLQRVEPTVISVTTAGVRLGRTGLIPLSTYVKQFVEQFDVFGFLVDRGLPERSDSSEDRVEPN